MNGDKVLTMTPAAFVGEERGGDWNLLPAGEKMTVLGFLIHLTKKELTSIAERPPCPLRPPRPRRPHLRRHGAPWRRKRRTAFGGMSAPPIARASPGAPVDRR